MRSKKPKPIYKGEIFDSVDEIEMMQWCEVAKENGWITDFSYHPEPFILSNPVVQVFIRNKKLKTKIKQEIVHKTILQDCTYKPDFVIVNPIKEIACLLEQGGYSGNDYLIDIKGVFCVQSSKTQVFSIIRKWVYQKYKRYINKVVTRDFFNQTFVPDSVRFGKSGKVLAKFKTAPTLETFKRRISNG